MRQPAAQEEPGCLRYARVTMPVGGGQEMAGHIEEGANCLSECEAPTPQPASLQPAAGQGEVGMQIGGANCLTNPDL